MNATLPRIHIPRIVKYFIAALLVVLYMGTMRASAITCPDGSTLPDAQADQCPGATTGSDAFPGFGDVKKDDCNAGPGQSLNSGNCGIVKTLIVIINILSAMVGVVIVAMLIVGGIQYSSAGDDPKKITAAKSRISNAILAFVVFIFMFAFLNWVVPGGVL